MKMRYIKAECINNLTQTVFKEDTAMGKIFLALSLLLATLIKLYESHRQGVFYKIYRRFFNLYLMILTV